MNSFIHVMGVFFIIIIIAFVIMAIIIGVHILSEKISAMQEYKLWRARAEDLEKRWERAKDANNVLEAKIRELEQELNARKQGEPYR